MKNITLSYPFNAKIILLTNLMFFYIFSTKKYLFTYVSISFLLRCKRIFMI